MSSGPYPSQQPPLFLQPIVQLPYTPIMQPANPSAPSGLSYPTNPGFMPTPVPQPGIQNSGFVPTPVPQPGIQHSGFMPTPPPQPGTRQQQPYIGFAPHDQFPAAPPPYPGPGQADFGKPSSGMSSPVGTMERDTTPTLESWNGFSNKEIRRVFVRKVYAILMVQLTITFGVVALFVFEPHVKLFVQKNFEAYIAAYVLFIVLYIALVCCESLRRTYPTNMILLFVFTLVMSYMVGVISSFHDTDTVLMASGICAACCLAVSIFSCHTKFDFTSCAGFLFIAVWALFLFGILTIFTYNRIMNTVYSVLGAVLFMAFLAFDTQMLMGGRKLELSPEEHIFAALQLYMDIVQIFLFLLRIVGRR
ncbi:protein lifeguard 2-like isoform X1 [Dermacentor andersoni]|uniref:protein lifeguard 2-like isoform X1 n=1 Tax=Dermacentor andersoni TaxID=34620 RepID=UPI0021551F64|nr:protein lifeguard 1-like isoform X1 [Dermacentor andersoni]XP_054927089.1 protein lifeguard 1-like isoform X1 [Dermacentor andersoni]